LQALPSKYRIPLYLYYYEEYSVREISECLRVKEGTIKSQLSRGRELLKENLKGDGADV
jgi:RNA polymerase sigma-70 factor (ECF subfamily)